MPQQQARQPTIADLDAPTTRVRVERCVCFDQPFEKLLRLARAEGLTQEQLSERTGCCTGCGMCKPYVRVVLSTGRTSIPLMNGKALKAIAEQAEALRAAEHAAERPTGDA
jgi:NAD(P)H-nitrite reductase large subunit